MKTTTCNACRTAKTTTKPCALCEWNRHAADLERANIPASLLRLFQALVIRNSNAITEIDPDSFVAANEPATSNAVTVNFEHRVLQMAGVVTWYQVENSRPFKPHATDFAAITRYVPLAAAMINEFLAEGFVVSEAPGKEGRGLRNAGIRFLKWETIGTGDQSRVVFVRGFLTWDVSYRRLPEGGVEKISD